MKSVTLKRALLLCTQMYLASSRTDMELYNLLMTNYSKKFQPDPIAPSTVKIEIALQAVVDVIEGAETVTYKQLLTLDWRDQRLEWRPSIFGLQRLRVPAEDIWIPRVAAPTLNDVEDILEPSTMEVVVKYDGSVSWSAYQLVNIRCPMNVKRFPNDEQTCSVPYMFVNRMKGEIYIEVVPKSPMEHTCENATNPEWTIIECLLTKGSTPFTDSRGTAEYEIANFAFTIRRKPGFYTLTQVMPASMITTLTLVGLFSPSSHVRERGERVSIGLTALLALSVVLTSVADTLPKNSEQFSRLGYFMLLELYVVAVGTAIAVMVMFAHSYYHKKGSLPYWLLCTLNNAHKIVTKSFNPGRKSISAGMDPHWAVLVQQLREIRQLVSDRLNDMATDENSDVTVNQLFYRLDLILLGTGVVFNVFIMILFLADA